MPARAMRKLVVDLSTQRSMARASFHTGTPSSRRRVKDAKPHRHRLKSSARNGAHDNGVRQFGVEAAYLQAVFRMACRTAPSRDGREWRERRALARARVSSRACQSNLSTASAMRSPGRRSARLGSAIERGVQYGRVAAPGVKAFARSNRGNDDLRGAEQHGIDRVKIALELPKYFRERPAVIARSDAWQSFRQALCVGRRPVDEKMHAAGIDDCVVRAPHRRDEIGMRRRQGRNRPCRRSRARAEISARGPYATRPRARARRSGSLRRDFASARK